MRDAYWARRCRYYTLVTLRHLAEEVAGTLNIYSQQGRRGIVSAVREQAHDLMRTLLDVLLRVAPAAGSKEEWQVEGDVKSWCGAAEVFCQSPKAIHLRFKSEMCQIPTLELRLFGDERHLRCAKSGLRIS